MFLTEEESKLKLIQHVVRCCYHCHIWQRGEGAIITAKGEAVKIQWLLATFVTLNAFKIKRLVTTDTNENLISFKIVDQKSTLKYVSLVIVSKCFCGVKWEHG